MDLDRVADTELGGLDPYAILDEEAARLAAFVATLDEEGWGAPTRCDGWSRRDLMAHLAATEEYHHGCLDDALGELLERGLAAGVADVHGFNDWGVSSRAGLDTDEVVAEWSTADAETRRRLRERNGGSMSPMAGQYPARRQAFHVASELATHADDLGVPIPAADAESRLAWRARFSRFALAEAGRGGIDVSEMDDGELVEGVAGRLGPDNPLADELSTMP